MATISVSDLKWAVLDVIEDAERLDQDAVRDALRAATVLTPEDCKVALIDALRHVRRGA